MVNREGRVAERVVTKEEFTIHCAMVKKTGM